MKTLQGASPGLYTDSDGRVWEVRDNSVRLYTHGWSGWVPAQPSVRMSYEPLSVAPVPISDAPTGFYRAKGVPKLTKLIEVRGEFYRYAGALSWYETNGSDMLLTPTGTSPTDD